MKPEEIGSLDPVHESIDAYAQEISQWVWREKYRWGSEAHPRESHLRVVNGVYAKDPNGDAKACALWAMDKGLWLPAGRIQAGAGTDNVVTWINCFVSSVIGDSMVGIADSLKDAMLTMQQGGGIGMNFSSLRPRWAFLQRTGSTASGPLPFMDMWDAMCKTIMSAGKRRGAMMGVMADNHPDIFEFVRAKCDGRRFKNFNLSVLISDAFLEAVKEDEDWDLGFPGVPPADENFVTAYEVDVEGEFFFVYRRIKARELWDAIIENTYEYSEPGVVFIDRINDRNNLYYCEHISATNPCGEQPLPANGACNLGSVNLARMVRSPFSPDSELDTQLLRNVVDIGVRFLDNVIDTTGYPLEAQQVGQMQKRRIGLGYTGLANALEMLGCRYGSEDSVRTVHEIGKIISSQAFLTSAYLAKERGPFPLYDGPKFFDGYFMQHGVGNTALAAMTDHGIRNGTLLSLAPTGSISLKENNCSSGCEPVFARTGKRKVLLHDDSYAEYTVKDYGYQVYLAVHSLSEPASHMTEVRDLSVEDHINILGAAQKWIDTSVSKTINCPKEMPFEDFKQVYDFAYARGAKGCTTYRPSDVRGAVLSHDEDSHVPGAGAIALKARPLEPRPEVLVGKTYKVTWPSLQSALYITINDSVGGGGKPFEIFCNTASTRHAEWITALTLMISAIMRRGEDISFIPGELKKVTSNSDIAWIDGTYYASLVARLGEVIEQHLAGGVKIAGVEEAGDTCPMCEKPTYIYEEGCGRCTSCTFTKCD